MRAVSSNQETICQEKRFGLKFILFDPKFPENKGMNMPTLERTKLKKP